MPFRPVARLPDLGVLVLGLLLAATTGVAEERPDPGGTNREDPARLPFFQETPPVTILYQNFPNPFPEPGGEGNVTHIWFDLHRRTEVELTVHDLRGRLIRSLIPGPGCGPVVLEAGEYGRRTGGARDPCISYSWAGLNDRLERVGSGVYLLRLQAAGVTEVRRMVLWP